MNKLVIFPAAAALCLANNGLCTTAQIDHADRLCAQASAAAATAEVIAQALAAADVPQAKIDHIVADIQAGRAILTASCAVIATVPVTPPAAHP